ncbi:X-linked retinitis pigmentosa GTPase regulator-like [Elysia marginata]|uniref:X-linked retinitis pigmentosa GTPase regulator-like n=1 Tax=Elysia marginata TaxID=1093978 RepID=A0AAV4JF05_9GAST|nr:X-linked retinitis pigmentosa GTPase regulator-like [Elysia marginata]
MAASEDSDIPETGAVFTFGKSKFADNLPNKFWVKNDKVLQIACGDEHTALIAESGRVFMFGPNDWGQLGLGQDNKGVNKPSCVKHDGKLYTMGETDGGKLGLPDDVEDTHIPQHVASISEPVKSVACGSTHTIALTESGDCYVFGEGESGQLGLGTDQLSTTTPIRLDLPFKVSQVSCGQNFTALISGSMSKFL